MMLKTRKFELYSFIEERLSQQEIKLINHVIANPSDASLYEKAYYLILKCGPGVLNLALPTLQSKSKLLYYVVKGLISLLKWRAKGI